MANRLALIFRVLRANDIAVGAGEESVNVSGSFSEVNRQHNPKLTLDGLGGELTSGAIASPNDAIRNVCLLQDANSGARPIDDPTDRRVIFGRLDGPEDITVTGNWTFENAQSDITGVDGQALTELEVGDTIQGPDGLFYEIETITDNTNVVLTDAYQGATASSENLIARRWILSFKKLVGGTEEDASFPTPKTVRFFFSAFLTAAQSNADWSMILHTSAERAPLPVASVQVPGRVLLAQGGSKLGAINLQNGGIPVPGGPFHTLNFTTNAVVVPGGFDGEVQVLEIGAKGDTGPVGSSGGTGPTGPQGDGLTALNTWEASSEFAGTPGNFTPVPFSFTRDVGHTIRILGAGIAKYRDAGFFSTNERCQLLSVTGIGTTVAQVTGDINRDSFITVFVTSAGD
jgi:hypothetical protein